MRAPMHERRELPAGPDGVQRAAPAATSRRRVRSWACAVALSLALPWGLLCLPGCAGPGGRSRALGVVGSALVTGGGVAWVAGARGEADALAGAGMVSVALGVACLVTATSLLAYETACEADAECPLGYACRQVPQPAGREPYSQCVPR